VFGSIDGLTSGVLHIFGRSVFDCRYRYLEWQLCFVIGISVALLFRAMRYVRLFDFASVYLVVLWDIFLDSLESVIR